MLRSVSKKHKKELYFSLLFIGTLTISALGYFFVTPIQHFIEDTYHGVFKVIVADRILKDDAVIYSNIAYCGSDNPRQTLDLYRPSVDVGQEVPLVVFIHGGAWQAGDKSTTLLSYYGEDILKSGIAIAALNYRLYPEVSYPKQNTDIACALAFLRANSRNYDISADTWAIFGDSAGAQLGAYAMSDETINAPLKLFIGFYGPYDMSAQVVRKPNPDLPAFRYTNSGRDAILASPLTRPAKKDATYMLIHGENDRVVHIDQSEKFYQKLLDEGVAVTFTRVQHATHYFSPRTRPTSQTIKHTITTLLTSKLQ